MEVLRSHAATACRMELDLTAVICNDAANEIEHLRHDLERVMAAETLYLNEAERLRAQLAAITDCCECIEGRHGIQVKLGCTGDFWSAISRAANFSPETGPKP